MVGSCASTTSFPVPYTPQRPAAGIIPRLAVCQKTISLFHLPRSTISRIGGFSSSKSCGDCPLSPKSLRKIPLLLNLYVQPEDFRCQTPGNMRKDWKHHKPELQRLYIVESRSLEQVRDIMKARGFNASTRAYRMRFHEWGFRKYNSSKNRERPMSLSLEPTPLTNEPSSSPSVQPYPSDDVVIIGEKAIPSRPLTVSLLIPLIPAEPQWIFTALVLKWQPDGEYMKTAISLLENPVCGQSLLAFSPTKSGHSFMTNVFKAITKNVSRGEQFQLIKALLEADQLHGTEIPPISPGWMRKWRSACNNDQWGDAKRQLVGENLISHEVGEIVLNCALVVIAERLLRSYKEKLEKFRAQFLCLGIWDSGDAETWRRCYIEILKDIGQRGLDLSLSLCKFSVLVLLWNEETAGFNYAEQRMALESLSLKQHKYVRLINKYVGINLHEVDDVVDNILPLETDPTIPGVVMYTHASTGSSSTLGPNMAPQPQQVISSISSSEEPFLIRAPISTLDEVMETLLRNWRADEAGAVECFECLVTDRYQVSIFESSPNSNENIFDLIIRNTQQAEQLPFTNVLLANFASFGSQSVHSHTNSMWWLLLYKSFTWPEFQSRFAQDPVEAHLGEVMSQEAVKLVLDCTVLSAGERILAGLQLLLNYANRLQREAYDRYSRQYNAILEEFQNRKLEADQCWAAYMRDLL